MKWFRRKPEPKVSIGIEEAKLRYRAAKATWEQDNPVKTYRISFMDDRHPIEVRARRYEHRVDEYVFFFSNYDPGRSRLVAVIPVRNVRAIEVTDADEADNQQ